MHGGFNNGVSHLSDHVPRPTQGAMMLLPFLEELDTDIDAACHCKTCQTASFIT